MSDSVKFIKIVPDGKALGYFDGRACFAIGPLPDETVVVEAVKIKKNYAEVMVKEIAVASEHRHEPAEAHFQQCSPWQGVDYDYQLALKRSMLEACFGRPELGLPVLAMVGAAEATGYRNKLEFGLLTDADKHMQLAFHVRGSATELVAAPDGCTLGSAAMNTAALKLLTQLNTLNISGYIQSLAVRQSQSTGKIIGIVGLHQAAKRDWTGLLIPELAGVIVSRVRAGHRHEAIWYAADTTLTESVSGTTIEYAYDGFFQTNVPMFGKALEAIVAAVPERSKVVDLYGGAGTMGLCVAGKATNVLGLEIDVGAVEQAKHNAKRAGLTNYRVRVAAAERLTGDMLVGADCVIVDPPRAGLDGRVVEALLEAAPARIIYLSCDPVTQARDLMRLRGRYTTDGVVGFDFYPGTLHVESLAILNIL